MLIKSQRDFWTGVLLAVLGVTSAVAAGQQWLAAGAATGSVALAVGLAAALALLGATLWFTSLTFETEGGEPISARGASTALAIAGAAALYAACVRPLGATAAGVLAAALAAVAGRRTGRAAVALAAAAVAGLALLAWAGFGGHQALQPAH